MNTARKILARLPEREVRAFLTLVETNEGPEAPEPSPQERREPPPGARDSS